jgi:hypothetical protein
VLSAHPRPVCIGRVAHGSHHRWCRIIRPSLRNGFNGLLRALPGYRDLLPPSLSRILPRRKLSASVGAPGPHDFAVRFKRRSPCVAKASHRIPPQSCRVRFVWRPKCETPNRSKTCKFGAKSLAPSFRAHGRWILNSNRLLRRPDWCRCCSVRVAHLKTLLRRLSRSFVLAISGNIRAFTRFRKRAKKLYAIAPEKMLSLLSAVAGSAPDGSLYGLTKALKS